MKDTLMAFMSGIAASSGQSYITIDYGKAYYSQMRLMNEFCCYVAKLVKGILARGESEIKIFK